MTKHNRYISGEKPCFQAIKQHLNEKQKLNGEKLDVRYLSSLV